MDNHKLRILPIDDMPPEEIIDAAYKVSTWFKERGISGWILDGCADRKLRDDPTVKWYKTAEDDPRITKYLDMAKLRQWLRDEEESEDSGTEETEDEHVWKDDCSDYPESRHDANYNLLPLMLSQLISDLQSIHDEYGDRKVWLEVHYREGYEAYPCTKGGPISARPVVRRKDKVEGGRDYWPEDQDDVVLLRAEE